MTVGNYYEIGRQKILDDAFEAMMKNDSQYGWPLWKNKDFDWWIQRELDYHNKRANWMDDKIIENIRENPEGLSDYALLYCVDGGHIDGNYLL